MHSAVLVCVSAVGCHHKTRIQNSMMHCFLSSALTYTCVYKKSYHGCWYIKDVVAVISCVYFLLRASWASKKATSAPIFYSSRAYIREVHRMLHNDYEDTISAFFLPVRFLHVRTARFIVGAHIDRSGLYENLIIKFHRSIFYTFSRATRVCMHFLPWTFRGESAVHET
jgi:hypothetical protein